MASTVMEREFYSRDYSKGVPLIRVTAATANGLKVTIPAEWRGHLVEFTARTTDCAFRFGGSGVQVDMATESGGAPPAITAGGKEPHVVIPAGTSKLVRIPAVGATLADGSTVIDTFAHISTGAGLLYMELCVGTGST